MRRFEVILFAGAVTLALAGCGQRAELKPAKGAALPPAPYGQETRPNAAALLKTPTIAIPERSVELRTKSEPRADDPFDLPPPETPVTGQTPSDAPSPDATATPTSDPTDSGN